MPTRSGPYGWSCPCGEPMDHRRNIHILDGEISHSVWSCPAGHVWEWQQVGWSSWQWFEVTAAVAALERMAS